MRWFKWFMTLLIIGLFVYFIYQNGESFNITVPFTFALPFVAPIEWTHDVATLVVMNLVIGFFVGFLLMLKPYFNVRRQLKTELQKKQEMSVSTTEETSPKPSPVATEKKSPQAS